MEKNTRAAIMCSNFTTLMLGICDIIGRGENLTICNMYEHMASDGSLDVVNLLTISADTKVSLHGQLSCAQT